MKKTLLILLLFVSIVCQGQDINRSHWSVVPVVKSTSLGGTMLLSYLNTLAHMGGKHLEYHSSEDGETVDISVPIKCWHNPRFRYLFPISSVSSPDGAEISRRFLWRDLLWGDYSHTFKFSAGYEVAWKSMVSPWGIFAGAEWEYHHLRLKNGNEAGAHYSQAIVPYLGVRYRVGGGTVGKKWMPNFELTGAYVNNFKYHCEHHYDKSALGNGFRGTIGVGINFTEFYTFTARYEHDFFDHFDKEFTPDGGATHPFEGYDTNFGSLSFSLTVDL